MTAFDQDADRSPESPSEASTGASSNGWHRKPPEVPRALTRLSQERARAESEIAARLKSRTEAAEKAFRDGSRTVDARRVAETAEARATHEKARARALQVYEADTAETKEKDRAEREAIQQKVRDDRHAIKNRHEQTRWEAGTVFEASDQGELQRQEEWVKALAAEEEDLVGLRAETDAFLVSYQKYRPRLIESKPDTSEPENPYEALRASIVEVVDRLQSVAMLKWPRSLAGGNVAWLFVLPWLILTGPAVYRPGRGNGPDCRDRCRRGGRVRPPRLAVWNRPPLARTRTARTPGRAQSSRLPHAPLAGLGRRESQAPARRDPTETRRRDSSGRPCITPPKPRKSRNISPPASASSIRISPVAFWKSNKPVTGS